jgi:hypothetical protein
MCISVLVLSNDFKWKVHDEYDVLRYIDGRKKRRRRNEASIERSNSYFVFERSISPVRMWYFSRSFRSTSIEIRNQQSLK